MAVLTIRDVPDEVHRALQVRASQNGRSAEAEVCEILSAALLPADRIRLGDALAEIGRELGLTDGEVELLNAVGVRTPAEPAGQSGELR